MGQVITAPAVWTPSEHDRGLFLAGGITGCPDWQQPVSDRLVAATTATVVNPRRRAWNMGADHTESRRQIAWEYTHLGRCRHVLFWFPAETLCPITLLELGAALADQTVDLFIGCHPDYARRFDVEVQTLLRRPYLKVLTDLDALVDGVIDYWTTIYP